MPMNDPIARVARARATAQKEASVSLGHKLSKVLEREEVTRVSENL